MAKKPTILNFLVYVNSCGISVTHLSDSIGFPVEEEKQHPILLPPTYNISENESRFKYVDDLSLAEAINLKDLEQVNQIMPRPLNYRERTQHQLPPHKSKLQQT